MLVGGWMALAGAVVLWRRRPTEPVGLLLAAAAAVWFVGEWDNPGTGAAGAFTAGLILSGASAPIVGTALVLSTMERPSSRRTSVSVALTVAVGVAAAGVLPNLFFDPVATGCGACPDNLILLAHDPDRSTQLARVGLSLALVVLAVLAATCIWNLIRSTSTRRRVVAPFVVSGLAHLGFASAAYAMSVGRGFIGSGPTEEGLWIGQALSLGAVGVAACWTQVRARRVRSRLAAFVLELGEVTRPGGLRALLASELGDDQLDVAYPLGDGRFVDVDGNEVHLPRTSERAQTHLMRGGETAAVILHRPGLLDDPGLIDEVTASARLALENERLRAQVRAKEADLRASRARVIEASDDARRRAERDLHDGAQQQIVAVLYSLRLARTKTPPDCSPDDLARLEQAAQQVQVAVQELREVAHGLHPLALSEEGLGAALDSLLEHSAVPIWLSDVPRERLAPTVEAAAYRIVAEAVKAGAAGVRFRRQEEVLLLEVEQAQGLDRKGLEDRVGALDGRLWSDSPAGPSSTLVIEIPCGAM